MYILRWIAVPFTLPPPPPPPPRDTSSPHSATHLVSFFHFFSNNVELFLISSFFLSPYEDSKNVSLYLACFHIRKLMNVNLYWEQMYWQYQAHVLECPKVFKCVDKMPSIPLVGRVGWEVMILWKDKDKSGVCYQSEPNIASMNVWLSQSDIRNWKQKQQGTALSGLSKYFTFEER